jgi:hypothetical protein
MCVPDAVDVVVGAGEFAGDEPAGLVLHELLEPVLVQLLVLHVVVLVLLCKKKKL